MPTYDYECTKCGHAFEQFQKMSDEPLTKCPECNKNALKRLIGPGAGIIFKGSGFYCTDYRKPSYKESQSKEKNSSKGGSKSSGGSAKKDKTSGKSDAKDK